MVLMPLGGDTWFIGGTVAVVRVTLAAGLTNDRGGALAPGGNPEMEERHDFINIRKWWEILPDLITHFKHLIWLKKVTHNQPLLNQAHRLMETMHYTDYFTFSLHSPKGCARRLWNSLYRYYSIVVKGTVSGLWNEKGRV